MSFAKTAVRTVLASCGIEIHRVKTSKFKSPYIKRLDFSGVTFDFWIADETASQWYDYGVYTSSAEMDQLTRLVQPGDRVLDVGAHHGCFMLHVSSLVGDDGFVFSVEAHPFNAMVANAQIGLNRRNNCKVLNAAASDRSFGTISIADKSNSSIVPSGGIDIPVVTVDQLDAEFGPFTVLKIDVEGYEAAVLDGSKNILARSPRIILEVHSQAVSPTFSDLGITAQDVIRKIPSNYRGILTFQSDRKAVREFPCVLPNEVVDLFLWPS